MGFLMHDPSPAALGQALLAWFRGAQRDLPWRHTSDPYRIWVSEIMLQQTQVSTVIPYYERWLARFPDVAALAAASLDEVLALWQGLGYYARARSLHRAAQRVAQERDGALPHDAAALLGIPGIGDYTAAAILSIAFGQDIVALDGNVSRVLCRLHDFAADPTSRAGRATLRGYAEAMLPPGEGGTFNQAMMELGALVCLPRAPRCEECPLAVACRARALGVQEARPVARPRRAVPTITMASALIERAGSVLLVRRVPQGLLGGLWELPGGEVATGEAPEEALARVLRKALALEITLGALAATVQHAYSHFHVRVRVYRAEAWGEPRLGAAWDDYRWVDAAARPAYGLTGVARKSLARAACCINT